MNNAVWKFHSVETGCRASMVMHMTTVVLVLVVLLTTIGGEASTMLRLHRRTATAVAYELVGAGGAIMDAEVARDWAESVTDALLNAASWHTGASLTVIRSYDGAALRCYLVLAGVTHAQERGIIVSTITRGLRATATPLATLILPDVDHHITSRAGPREGRERMGAISGWAEQVSSLLATGTRPGYLVVSLEAMTVAEVTTHKAWIAQVLEAGGETAATHPQFASGKLMRVRLLAGVSDEADATGRALVTAASNFLPGYDFAVSAARVGDRHVVHTIVATTAALTALTYIQHASVGITAVILALGCATALVVGTGVLRVSATLLGLGLDHGVVVVPRAGYWRRWQVARRARKVVRILRCHIAEGAARRRDAAGKKGAALRANRRAERLRATPRRTDPRHTHTVVFAPAQTAAVLVPPTSATTSAEVTATLALDAPAAVRNATGTLIGHDPSGAPCHIPDADRQHGIYLQGDAGKGKTNAVLNLWAADLATATSGAGAGTMTLLAFDVKGDSALADAACAIADVLGVSEELIRVDVAATTGPMLRLLDPTHPKTSAEAFVAALTYALTDGAIMDASRAVLLPAFQLALSAGPVTGLTNPVSVAFTLLGGDGAEAQGMVLSALRGLVLAGSPAIGTHTSVGASAGEGSLDDFLADLGTAAAGPTPVEMVGVADTEVVELAAALREWDAYMALRAPERNALFKAPLNKMARLMRTSQVFNLTEQRPGHSLAELIASARPVVINFGGGGGLAEADASFLAALVTHLLWTDVKTTCAGWLDAGRSLTLYCDELSNIAGPNDDTNRVVADLREKGRALGLRLVLATQRSSQLPHNAAMAMGSMGAKLYLALAEPSVAEPAHRQLVGAATDSFTVDDLTNLGRGIAIAKVTIGGDTIRRPFTLHIPDAAQLLSQDTISGDTISGGVPTDHDATRSDERSRPDEDTDTSEDTATDAGGLG